MKKVIFVLMFLSLLTACGRILLPYHENFLCSKGAEAGYCGSLRDVYNQVLKEQKYREYEKLLYEDTQKQEKGENACKDYKN